MEVLTEMDEYFNAMSKINMDEPVMPYVKGRLVESDTYNKVQKILNTPELEKAHMYCYDLDLENLEECDIMKINNLYKLGVDRGFIDDDLQYQDCKADDCCKNEEPKAEAPASQVNPRAKIPCFVAMYSAMKDGQIKTGEAYSRAISVQAAKADVMNQLSKFGYTNISILAVEATEEDACACTVTEGALGAAAGTIAGLGAAGALGAPGLAAAGLAAGGAALGSKLGEDDYLKGRVHNGHLPEGEVEEDDMLDGRPHNNHIPEAEDDAADDSADDAGSEEAEDDSAEDDSAEDDSTSEEAASDDVSAEDTGSEDDSADDSAEEDAGSEDDSTEDDSTDDTGSEEAVEDGEEKEDAEASDDAEGDDVEATNSKEDAEDELDDNKKADLKDNYKKTFKNTMLKCKFEDKSFDDLTITEKVKFFTELSKTWKEDYEPSAFMTDKEIDQLNKITIKK